MTEDIADDRDADHREQDKYEDWGHGRGLRMEMESRMASKRKRKPRWTPQLGIWPRGGGGGGLPPHGH